MNLMCVFRREFSEVLKQMLIFKHMNDLISVKWSTSACSEFKDYRGPKCFAELLSVELGLTHESRQSTNPKHGIKPGRKRDLGKGDGREHNAQRQTMFEGWLKIPGE